MLKKILAALLLSLLMIPFALADDVLRPGDKGEAVSQLQTMLALTLGLPIVQIALIGEELKALTQ